MTNCRSFLVTLIASTWRQVRDIGDEEALECYCKIRSEDLDWETVVRSAIFDNIRLVCERHGSQIKDFSASNKKRTAGTLEHRYLKAGPLPRVPFRDQSTFVC